MKELQQELKEGRIRSAYLLYGEEAYLKRQYKQKIQKACIQEDDTINFHHYEGGQADVQEVIAMAQTVPFFAPRRLLLLQNTGWFKSSCDEMADYLEHLPDTVCLLFVEEDVDKRTRTYKAMKKYGCIAEFGLQDDKALTAWVVSILKKNHKKIKAADMQILLQKTGNDMDLIYQEVEKLICYTGEREIVTGEDIEAVCTTQIDAQVFAMIDAMTEGRRKQALSLYYDLLALKEAPLKILALINRQFHLLFQVKAFVQRGYSKNEIASRMGQRPYFVARYMNQAKRFSMGELQEALETGVSTEEDIKTGRIADKMGVELLIVRYSQDK